MENDMKHEYDREIELWLGEVGLKYGYLNKYETIREYYANKSDFFSATIRHLAKEVLGVREWLLEHKPDTWQKPD